MTSTPGTRHTLLGCVALIASCAGAPPPHPVATEPPPARVPLRPEDQLTPSALLREPQAQRVADAVRLRQRGAYLEALAALDGVASTGAALERARLHLVRGDLGAAALELEVAGGDRMLTPLVHLTRGQLALASGDDEQAAAELLPLLDADPRVARTTAPLLAVLLARHDPRALVAHRARLQELAAGSDIEAQSILLGQIADAQEATGDTAHALATRTRRYLSLPHALATPTAPPTGAEITPLQALDRAERLLEVHRNERALEALRAIDAAALTPDNQCRRQFALGLGERKEHHYANAEAELDRAIAVCRERDVQRRARYLRVKVISIRDGMRAIAEIDDFAKRYPGHSMVDDVLFWAGDLYQRRDRDPEAESYFRRAAAMTPPGDHCGESRWRIAWMAYRRKDLPLATTELEAMLTDRTCVSDRIDRARAAYWLGRTHSDASSHDSAIASFVQAAALAPADYYGQAARRRLAQLGDVERARVDAVSATDAEATALCVGTLAGSTALERGLEYLTRGLLEDAAAELREVAGPLKEVVGATHADSLGLAAHGSERVAVSRLASCGAEQSSLLLALLLDQAGAQREAHWQLRTDFAAALERLPDVRSLPVWRAAYPLALRPIIESAEREAKLPPLLLQALVREESALDPLAVSWAGAYGLSQLLVSVAREAASMLNPPPTVARGEDLLDPALSARLGATFLGYLIRHYGGSEPLAIAGYNAGEPTARKWWHRHQGEPLDVLAEELTIKETRAYLKRVLRTYGTYRWLYGDGDFTLPVDEPLPPAS